MRPALILLLLSLAWAPLQAEIGLTRVTVHEYEDGPPIPRGQVFSPGETVFLSFQLSGFQTKSDENEDRHVSLAYTIEAADPSGRPITDPKSGKVETRILPEDKKWLPKVRYSVQLPDQAPSGKYLIRISIKDLYGDKTSSEEVPIQVGGYEVQSSDKLAIQNFRLYRAESDSKPIAPDAAYRPGDPIWARFEITGFRLAGKNRYEVRYGIRLLDPAGNQLFSDPNAAQAADESAYPKRYIPGVLNLHLDRKCKPGTYTVIVTATDPIGQQQLEDRHDFRVEN